MKCSQLYLSSATNSLKKNRKVFLDGGTAHHMAPVYNGQSTGNSSQFEVRHVRFVVYLLHGAESFLSS